VRFAFLIVFLMSKSISASDVKQAYRDVVGSLPKATVIVVEDYITADGGIFRGSNFNLDGEDDFFFRAEHLAKAMGVSYKSIVQKGSKMKEQKLTLKNDLSIVEGKVFMEDVIYKTKE